MELVERFTVALNVTLGIALVILGLFFLYTKIKDDDGDE